MFVNFSRRIASSQSCLFFACSYNSGPSSVSERPASLTSSSDDCRREVLTNAVGRSAHVDDLRNLGFSPANIEIFLKKIPKDMEVLPLADIDRVIDFLNALGLDNPVALLTKHPCILVRSVEELEDVVNTLFLVFSKKEVRKILNFNTSVLMSTPEEIAERYAYATLTMGLLDKVASNVYVWKYNLALFKARHILLNRLGMFNAKSFSRLPAVHQISFIKEVYRSDKSFLKMANISSYEWTVFQKMLIACSSIDVSEDSVNDM